jgi:hypothetical protein
VDTQEIVADQLTPAYADDARQLKGLLGQVDTPITRSGANDSCNKATTSYRISGFYSGFYAGGMNSR